jgi:uncharacterized repeat protein (TIGR03803 family)
MPARKGLSRTRTTTLVAMSLFLSVLAVYAFASSPVEETLYSFTGFPDGNNPYYAALVADASGDLYGTTYSGGSDASCSCGTVFELSPPATAGGAWTETILHSFRGSPNDGASPYNTLIFDKQGNLYGATYGGGDVNGGGTVFELSPPASPGGAWTETILYVFPSDQSQGVWPGKLTFDGVGNLYGTTAIGGKFNAGTIFQLKPPQTPGGSWTEHQLYVFGSVANDGTIPGTALVFHLGALYGTTQSGGADFHGTVFQLTPKNGIWSENTLYTFTGSEGGSAVGALVVDGAGNLYGTATNGGFSNQTNCVTGCGSVFELSPPAVAGDPWQETTLFIFQGDRRGGRPYGGVIRDKSNNLYGTTSAGGVKNLGVIYKLTPPSVPGGAWTPSVLHVFHGSVVGDGSFPMDSLILFNGVFYGTTRYGGTNGLGTVFSLSR